MFHASAISGQASPRELPAGWAVMDRQKYCVPKARSPIKEADSFVVFDEARCRCGSL